MFGKKGKANYDRPTTIIGKEAVVDSGKIESKSSVQVNGKVLADMAIESSLVIGQKGYVEGNINAGFVLVAGKIVGNLEVVHQIHLTKTAIIVGDIMCESIVVDNGAQIDGNFSMKEPLEVEINSEVAELS